MKKKNKKDIKKNQNSRSRITKTWIVRIKERENNKKKKKKKKKKRKNKKERTSSRGRRRKIKIKRKRSRGRIIKRRVQRRSKSSIKRWLRRRNKRHQENTEAESKDDWEGETQGIRKTRTLKEGLWGDKRGKTSEIAGKMLLLGILKPYKQTKTSVGRATAARTRMARTTTTIKNNNQR